MAYEKRISDWSSDVCSSDLRARLQAKPGASFFCATRLVVGSVRIRRIDITPRKAFFIGPGRKLFKIAVIVRAVAIGWGVAITRHGARRHRDELKTRRSGGFHKKPGSHRLAFRASWELFVSYGLRHLRDRSAERREGKGWVSTGRSRGVP